MQKVAPLKNNNDFKLPMSPVNDTGGDSSNTSRKRWCRCCCTSGQCSNFCKSLFIRKDFGSLVESAKESKLKRSLGVIDVTCIGIGAIIGSGIFVLTGRAAATNAGPAVCISFIIAGIAAGAAALCYAELASMIPLSGSAYTYSYATMGELLAWIIGWDLILEYLVGAAAVAVGWSGYFMHFLGDASNKNISGPWNMAPVTWNDSNSQFVVSGGYLDLPAFFICIALTVLLIVGVQESARMNAVAVVIKTVVILMFIFAAAKFVNNDNYVPFVPKNEGKYGKFGATGILQGATTIFFAYIGFDAVSTVAQECKNPQRNMPLGIIISLVVCTVLYMATAVVLTGVANYKELDVAYPIALAMSKTGLKWMTIIIDIGAVAGLTSVLLVSLLGQTRIFMAMAKDGLLPGWFGKIHPRFKTPYITTAISGLVCAIAAAFLPLDILSDLTSVGTLAAFALVSLAVIILRYKNPEAPRRFRVPLGPFVIPLTSALISLLLIFSSTWQTILRLVLWMLLGFIFYFCYGHWHSKLKFQLAHQEQNFQIHEVNGESKKSRGVSYMNNSGSGVDEVDNDKKTQF